MDNPRALSHQEIYDHLAVTECSADPHLQSRHTAHWVMNLQWYKAIRRAFLPEDADDDARDEAKWEPRPGDTVFARDIVVMEDGGAPHLVDRRLSEAVHPA